METIRIADFGTVITGKTPSSNNLEQFGEDYPFITPTDISEGRIVHTERSISEEGYIKFRRQILPPRSVCFVCIGATIGKICMTTAQSLTNQQINSVIVDTTRHDPFFVYYLLSTLAEEVKSVAGGAATPIVNKTTFENLQVDVPPLPVQRKIAAILSAYDDLIENNLRRIKILEEMAQNLYREWFVKFRFPGHQHTRFVDSPLGSIPEGWEVVKLAEVANVNRMQINTCSAPDEIHYIDISSVSPGQINSITTYAFTDAPGRARRVVQHGDILWSCVRPNRRSHVCILHPKLNTIASTGFAVLTATKVPFTFLYFSTTTDDFVGYLTNSATGSAYPAVTRSTFEKADLILSPMPLLKMFEDITIPLTEHINTLQSQIQILRRTRDLLLPKLISGEVDVSALDIAVPAEVL